MSSHTSVRFGALESFDPLRVGNSSNTREVITRSGDQWLYPGVLTAFLRDRLADPKGLSRPFWIHDPDVIDCRYELDTPERPSSRIVFWCGSYMNSAAVQQIIHALVSLEQLPGRWRLSRAQVGKTKLIPDGRGYRAEPPDRFPAQPRFRRRRAVAETSKYDWESMAPGETRPFLDVSDSALRSHFSAWARRRGLNDRRIRTRTLVPGLVEVTLQVWHGG